MLNQIRAVLSVVIVVVLFLGGDLIFGGQPAAAADGEELDLSRIERPEKGNPKLDSRLNQLVSANTTRKVESFAQEHNIEMVDDNIRVIIECLPDEVDAAVKAADDSGVVETSYRNLLQVVVPVSQLTTLADTRGIRLVRLPSYPVPDVVSEGVALINADDWQTASYNGTGVKVAILDGGFTGYSSLLGTELPSSVTTQSFYAGSDIEGYSSHGTGCAEIVYDIAPDADFYLVNYGTDIEMGNAVDWLIAQGVDVISHSMGWPIYGPGDGTELICEIVDDAHATDIIWSQSAGNYAQKHWQGDFADGDTDGWHNFSGSDESNAIYVSNGDLIRVGLRWDDTWGSSGNDYDLYLSDYNIIDVDWSDDTQDGDDDPVEYLSYTATYTGYYHIFIDGFYATATANLEIFCYRHNLQYQVASHSLSVPADSGNATTVGAVGYSTPTALESFSSRGPTTDSRVKPDLVAPDGVSTSTYGATAFYGTSASAPHVAGAAALVKECYPIYTNAQIQSFLEGRAVELGAGGKDNLFGSGRLDLGSITLPTMEAIIEAEGGYCNTAPVLSNFGFDDDTDLDDGWYQMDSYTGSWTSLFTDVSGTEWNNDSWPIPGFGALSEGSHTIYFKASDDVGNLEGESGEWSWQFYKDTIAPADPTSVSSPSHTVSTWSSDNTVDISWTDATDATSGLDGYSVLWDTNASTIPDQTKDIEEGVQSANSTALSDGSSHYFHIRSVDNAGNWQSTVHVGPFFIETVPPTDPTGVSSTSHTVSTWSSDSTVDISWTDATDATSGLDGYSVLWDTNASTIPDQIKDIEEGVQTTTSSALADGSSHYFHIRSVDNAGNWQSTVHVGPFFIDANPPTDPTGVSSTSHTVSTWSSDNTVAINWTDATDSGSGLDGYSVLWDTNASTIPDQTKDIEEGVQTTTSSALADGSSHYFHIRSVDNLGNWQSTVHVGPFYIDANPPTDPTSVSSTSHTVSTWSSDSTVDISWTDATDATSGLDGYSVLWDTNASTIPDQIKDIEEGVQTTTSSALADGSSHYFHIRSVDNAGNWQSTVHVGPFYIDATPPTDPTSVSSLSHTVSTWSSDNTVGIAWTDATDGESGLDGYSVLWDTNASTIPDQTKDIEEGVQTTTSSALADGNSHYFHIRSVDNIDNWQSTVHLGPFYIAVNCPILSDGAVSPTSGGTSANFTYSANYTDFENDAPSSITISIDGGASENMTVKAGQDSDYTNGEIYEYWIIGSNLGVGSHTFQFTANDGTDNAIGDIGSHSGPTVSSPPKVVGGGGGGGGPPPPGVTKVIDVMSSKGQFKEDVTCESEDKCVELFIPEDTIGKRKAGPLYNIKILEVADPPPSPEQTNLIGLVYDFSPEGTTFDPPVDLTIRYDESLMLEGIDENSLIIATWDKDASQWVEFESTVDPENNTVTTKINHFTEFSILAHTRPADFAVTNLSITPKEVDFGESVSVSVTVTNTGDLSGECELCLKTDDVISQTKELTLTGGSSQRVTFSVTKDTAGTCCVDVNGLIGSLVVREEVPLVAEEEIVPTPALAPVPIPTPAEAPPVKPPINLWLIGGIIAGCIVVGLLVYFFVWRKRSAPRPS